jgi:hypothetical protein
MNKILDVWCGVHKVHVVMHIDFLYFERITKNFNVYCWICEVVIMIETSLIHKFILMFHIMCLWHN